MSSKRLLLPAIATLMVVLLGGCKKDLTTNEPNPMSSRNSSNTSSATLGTPQAGVNLQVAQSPPLGTTSGFALFTAAGAFSNVGTATYVTGDVGTNGGAFTAFPSGTLVGSIHVVDAVSAQAATDAASAYSYISGLTCGSGIGTTLGSGQILTPNIYCLGAASSLSGDLKLDGQGDSNAIFIFKVNGAFTTSTLSNIVLINSASLSNVYWQINGAFTLGDGSVFRGTILANGAIVLSEGSSLFGRGLSTAGAITLHNNLVKLKE
jgi:Ice-binding-like